MKLFFIDNNSQKLIFFLTGWGCDEKQFSLLKSYNFDILIGYDYSNLDFDFDFSKYKEVNLLTFSAGVFIAGIIKDKLPKINKSVAVNGNPLSYDKYFGLQDNIIDLFKNIAKNNIVNFREEYLVSSKEELKKLNYLQPNRSVESCLTELIQLQKYYLSSFEPMKYDLVCLSDSDKIFNLEKQKEFFNYSKIFIIKNSAHFPFFKFKTYEELMQL